MGQFASVGSGPLIQRGQPQPTQKRCYVSDYADLVSESIFELLDDAISLHDMHNLGTNADADLDALCVRAMFKTITSLYLHLLVIESIKPTPTPDIRPHRRALAQVVQLLNLHKDLESATKRRKHPFLDNGHTTVTEKQLRNMDTCLKALVMVSKHEDDSQ